MKIETKFKIGDTVYYLQHRAIHSATVRSINIRVDTYYTDDMLMLDKINIKYNINGSFIEEKYLFPDKESLKASL